MQNKNVRSFFFFIFSSNERIYMQIKKLCSTNVKIFFFLWAKEFVFFFFLFVRFCLRFGFKSTIFIAFKHLIQKLILCFLDLFFYLKIRKKSFQNVNWATENQVSSCREVSRWKHVLFVLLFCFFLHFIFALSFN